MSLFRIHTQSHGAIPTQCYHFEHSHRDQCSDRLCQRCTTNTVGCEAHAILDYPYSKRLALPLIRKIRALLYNAGQASWDFLLIPQQISLILGNPPELLPKKLHKAWTEVMLKESSVYLIPGNTPLHIKHDHSSEPTATHKTPTSTTRHTPKKIKGKKKGEKNKLVT